MSSSFEIAFDQLRKGKQELLDGSIEPGFLEVTDSKLRFPQKIDVKGRAYLADDHLIIDLHIKTRVVIPCKICNEDISLDLEIPNIQHAEPINEIQGHLYDAKALIREEILLAAPTIGECNGNCPKREEFKEFLNHESTGKESPFADLTSPDEE